MPEQYQYKRKRGALLSEAYASGYLIHIRCQRCRTAHLYSAHDLKELAGDVAVDALVNRMRCDTCGKRDSEVRMVYPAAAERLTLTVRRLVKAIYQRKVIWRDEKLE